jgi:hypothetical protein
MTRRIKLVAVAALVLAVSLYFGVANASPDGVLVRGTRIDLGSALVNGLAAFGISLVFMCLLVDAVRGAYRR